MVGVDSRLKEVIVEMTQKRLGITAVTDKNDELLGVITDGDLRRMLEKGGDLENMMATSIMSPNPKTIEASSLAVGALDLMRKNNITQLLVMDNRQVCWGHTFARPYKRRINLMKNNHYVAIMAGGIGSRFWPMSRTHFPKQFLDILGIGQNPDPGYLRQVCPVYPG